MNTVNKSQSKSAIRRVERRNSEETADFKEKILLLLKHAEPDVAYSIKRDLKTMVCMPFYGDIIVKVKSNKSKIDMIKAYVELLINHSEIEFTARLLSELSKQQNQVIRKAAPRKGKKLYRWEHVIPCAFVVKRMIDMIRHNNTTTLDKLLFLYAKAGQRPVTHETDILLRKYNSCMPNGWDWTADNVDPFARHTEFGLSYDEA
ncbi:hypothetical protein [Hymenobacter mucosus]|uniref:Uncharacterized protein n=1 Tax=Hymenobacter mucosus TaxID=1411120 RepID=A0A238YBF2_9BACT|nr:hypothetical protein [Hymenobacter mucosus]SNR68350.1 hypothetical protein SAMN06269173_105102 [Hymenobacter mucosus]